MEQLYDFFYFFFVSMPVHFRTEVDIANLTLYEGVYEINPYAINV